MIFGSVCSGIEAASVAWLPLGWECAFVAEIDRFCCAVLKHRFPEVPNHGDFTAILRSAGPIDVLVGGTPCQGFSVAGLRRGLADDRSNLALGFLRLVDRLRPEWVVWENVPGIRSIHGGRDFGAFLGGLAELGYGWAYRSLDARFFGLAQRRERVFVVASPGDWRPPAAVLFERASLSGHPAPRREAGSDVASALTGSLGGGGACAGRAQANHIVSHCLNGSQQRLDGTVETLVAHTLRGDGFDASEDGTGRGTPLVAYGISSDALDRSGEGDGSAAERAGLGIVEELSPSLRARSNNAVAFQTRIARNGRGQPSDVVHALTSAEGGSHADSKPHVAHGSMVRRLTPLECERLQGFPDDWTLVPYCGKPVKDGPRYKAIGNSMAIPVMRWIGERIQTVHEKIRQLRREA